MTTNDNTDATSQPRILVGSDDFSKLLLKSDVFVDKSLLVKDIIEDSGDVILITRPRRWGKSLNMDMVHKFLEIEVDNNGAVLPLEQRVNRKLFTGGEVDLGFGENKILRPLKIAHNKNAMVKQGQFPVIQLNFKEVKGNSYQEIEAGIRYQVISLFAQYQYLNSYVEQNILLLDDAQKEQMQRYFTGQIDKQDLKSSLRILNELLFKHFGQKAYILIDEYDTPINSS